MGARERDRTERDCGDEPGVGDDSEACVVDAEDADGDAALLVGPDEYPPLRIVVPAAGLEPPVTSAACSIFALAASGEALGRRLWRQTLTPAAPCLIERDVGLVRLIRVRPEETAAWQEKEQRRRAKQRPPRPPKGARTHGKKLRAVIKFEFDD